MNAARRPLNLSSILAPAGVNRNIFIIVYSAFIEISVEHQSGWGGYDIGDCAELRKSEPVRFSFLTMIQQKKMPSTIRTSTLTD